MTTYDKLTPQGKEWCGILYRAFNTPPGKKALEVIRHLAGKPPPVEVYDVSANFSTERYFTRVGMNQLLEQIEQFVSWHEKRKKGDEEDE